MGEKRDSRTWDEKLSQALSAWAMILGLAATAIVWTLIAWASIGSGTMHHPDFNLPDPTPAAQAYNTIGTYQRPQR